MINPCIINQMITYLVKIALLLKPFHKVTYLLAMILVAHLTYQLAFSVTLGAEESSNLMLSLLALAWLALVNLMIQVFSQVPVVLQRKSSFLTRIKNRFHRGIYYFLSLVFVAISIAVIFLSIKMLRV